MKYNDNSMLLVSETWLTETWLRELKADLIILLADHGYPPVDRDEVYKEIFEQAENFKKY
ncbi:type I restriction enzyme endonuclease domain-containing protein [Desulfonatronospira thiodismutans]|uniref:type I restriction enzyme endonuclease domain-containing protein n=1 Tax=Desulfonatronospira thiodismutans TaxID=488939 RepID=UPI0013756541|nr:type I restriction enzyme endonuclease domain-containing protein [Desulfonatronospira thiodismutans]